MRDVKKRLQRSELKIGSVIGLPMFTLLVAAISAGSLEELFVRKVKLKIHLKDLRNLQKGAPGI